MYRESFDEVASMLQTFGGSATARIDLSIMVDGALPSAPRVSGPH